MLTWSSVSFPGQLLSYKMSCWIIHDSLKFNFWNGPHSRIGQSVLHRKRPRNVMTKILCRLSRNFWYLRWYNVYASFHVLNITSTLPTTDDITNRGWVESRGHDTALVLTWSTPVICQCETPWTIFTSLVLFSFV